MYATLRRLRMASTVGGMRRILKHKGTVPNYIRQAVETGVYRSNEELEKVWKERRESADDLKTVMRRFRQDIVRGSSIQDYPVEYLILKQHPPVPDPPKIPVKLRKQMKLPPNPTERLVTKYMNRYEKKQRSMDSSDDDVVDDGAPKTVEEYYRRLLGVPAPPIPTALGQKTAGVQKAYAAAVKHYQLQRTEGLSEHQALQRVDALLQAQEESERVVSQQRAERAQRDADRRRQENKATLVQEVMSSSQQQQQENDNNNKENDLESLMTVFDGNVRTVEAMMHWSMRLQAVPYREWTVGASTALDHWIARQLLGLSEETWQSLVEGVTGDDPSLLSKGRDIVTVRETLFPETILDKTEEEVQEGVEELEAIADKEDDTREKSIEELLVSLGNLNQKSEEDDKTDDRAWSWLEDADAENLDTKVDQIVEQLQTWRQKNVDSPYEEWSKEDKDEFNIWMKEYVTTLASDAEKGQVDYDTTRQALLSLPPVSRDESEDFWSQLKDEGQAAVLLDAMRKDGPPAGASILHAAFWDLPYEKQLRRLMNIGALRPLLDEYTKESDRLKFLQRHGDTLLAGVKLEHLVPDPEGPIRGSDLGAAADTLDIAKDARFRLKMLPYMATENVTAQEKTRALFYAWNQHKAGRARYEEKMFKTGRLGLRYGDRMEDEEE